MSAREGLLCTIGTHKYLVDTEAIEWATVRPTRQGVDQSAGAGEASLSNEVVWRRRRYNWIGGAGQEYADLADEEDPSSAIRYASSVNADPWTQRILTVGRPRVEIHANAGPDLIAPCEVSGGGGFFLVDNANAFVFQCDPRDGTWSEVVGATALPSAPLDIASFGDTVMYMVAADGSAHTVTFDEGAGTLTVATFGSLGPGTEDMIAACGTRLIAAKGPELFELSAAGAKSTIYTHSATSFRWRGAVASNNGIYAWGDVGGTGQIFRLPISDATGAVDPPVPAATLPVGEAATEVVMQTGLLVIGTNLGVRLGTIEADGSVQYGPVVDDIGGVTGLTTAGRFVYAASTQSPNVWRLDPSRFSEVLAPAFAAESNLLTDGTEVGAVYLASSVVDASGSNPATPVVAVVSTTALSFYADEVGGVPAFAGEATVDLGWFSWGIGEQLSLDSVTVEVEPFAGSQQQVTVYVDTPETEAVLEASTDFADGRFQIQLTAGEDIRARRFKVRLLLVPDTTVGAAPQVREVILRAAPAPHLSDEMILPVILTPAVDSEFGQRAGLDVWEEWSYLRTLRDSRERVSLQLGAFEATVRVEDIGVRGGGLGGGNGLDGWDRDTEWIKGTWDVRLVTVEDDV